MGSHPHWGPGAKPLAGGQGGGAPLKRQVGGLRGWSSQLKHHIKHLFDKTSKSDLKIFRQKIEKIKNSPKTCTVIEAHSPKFGHHLSTQATHMYSHHFQRVYLG